MLKDGVLVVEQSLIWQPKRLCDLQHFTLALTGLDGWSERPDPINRLIMSAQLKIPLYKLKIEMDSTPTFKKPGELKQKAQAPIGLAGRVNTNTEVFSKRPGGTIKLPPA